MPAAGRPLIAASAASRTARASLAPVRFTRAVTTAGNPSQLWTVRPATSSVPVHGMPVPGASRAAIALSCAAGSPLATGSFIDRTNPATAASRRSKPTAPTRCPAGTPVNATAPVAALPGSASRTSPAGRSAHCTGVSASRAQAASTPQTPPVGGSAGLAGS